MKLDDLVFITDHCFDYDFVHFQVHCYNKSKDEWYLCSGKPKYFYGRNGSALVAYPDFSIDRLMTWDEVWALARDYHRFLLTSSGDGS